jgi:predicted DNA-binding transcriptional regulator AlpA
MIVNIFGRVLHAYKMSMVVVAGTMKSEEAERAEPPLQSTQELNRSRSRAPKTGTDFERLLTPREAAQFLRLSLSWLAKARMRGDGPPYVKLGRSVRYRESDLIGWLKARARLCVPKTQIRM